jgi:carboxyl-terminal processing protease
VQTSRWEVEYDANVHVEAVAKMRGKKGTKLKISIAPVGAEKAKDFALMRETIKVQSVRSEMIEDGYGWVRLSSFNEDAARDVANGIKKLEKNEKLKELIFDLRYNPGGLLDQAVDVASLFIDEGVIVSTMVEINLKKKFGTRRKEMLGRICHWLCL